MKTKSEGKKYISIIQKDTEHFENKITQTDEKVLYKYN